MFCSLRGYKRDLDYLKIFKDQKHQTDDRAMCVAYRLYL